MKLVRFSVCLFAMTQLWAHAGMEIDSKVYRMDKLDEARAKAVEEGKPVAFLYTDEKSSCPKCCVSAYNTMNELKSRTVMVYVDTEKGDIQRLPKPVQEALRSPALGKYIPKTVVFKPQLDAVLMNIPYALGEEQGKLLKEAKKVIKEATPRAGNTLTPLKPASKETGEAPKTQPGEQRTWTSRTGSEIKASLVRNAGAYLILQTGDGKEIRVFRNKLSQADLDYIDALKAE
jgi:hypothetical protein